ncbi:MAG: FecR domain-containing protein [Proteobacteria bacterium]|nr:FecR domain-containing protein [Pseudomonadota bacterium]
MEHIKKQFAMIMVFCLLGSIMTIQSALSRENEPIGKVTAVRGNVIAIDAKENSRALYLKAPVFLKDTIKTENGRIQMMFKDNTLITLGQNSNLQITKYLWEPGNTRSNMETRVEEGSFRILGGAITRVAPDNFKTDSPSGTIGIRGSMYAGRVENASLFVVFQGGKGIYVQNATGMVDITRPGFGTQVKSLDQAPEEPRKIAPEELQKLESALATAPLPPDDLEKASAAEPDTATEPDTANTDTADTDAADTDTANTPVTDSTNQETQDSTASEDSSLAQLPSMEDTPAASENSSPEPVTDISAIVSDITVSATQDSVNDAMTPTGAQQTIQFMLLGLGVTDISLSSGLSKTGISEYKGNMKDILHPDETDQHMKFVVNWHNNRIIGFEEMSSGPVSPGFGFGTINQTTGVISGMRILGSGGEPGTGEIMTLTGSETFGHFYGSDARGLGLAMEGNDYNVRDQNQSVPWSDIIAAVREDTPPTPSSTGTATWNGFFTGVSEDMAAPNTNRRVFTNSSAADFSLSINKDTGTFSGSLAGVDFNDSANNITALAIGGDSSNSAYLTDKILAAAVTGATISGSTSALKTYGNYLVTANEAMLSDYTTWGYWEIAYVDPATSKDYHLHVPGSMWIAGEKTSSGAISTLISTPFSGIYKGGAKGVMIDSSNNMSELTNGATNLNINFASGASPSISGTISFTGTVSPTGMTTNTPTALEVERITNITGPDFTADITGATGSNHVNGSFYGPSAQAVGGNFNAEKGGTQYHGIFGGNLQ